jgi:hypothetical protein
MTLLKGEDTVKLGWRLTAQPKIASVAKFVVRLLLTHEAEAVFGPFTPAFTSKLFNPENSAIDIVAKELPPKAT